jgi:hypothetical protein
MYNKNCIYNPGFLSPPNSIRRRQVSGWERIGIDIFWPEVSLLSVSVTGILFPD